MADILKNFALYILIVVCITGAVIGMMVGSYLLLSAIQHGTSLLIPICIVFGALILGFIFTYTMD